MRVMLMMTVGRNRQHDNGDDNNSHQVGNGDTDGYCDSAPVDDDRVPLYIR